MSRCFDLGCAGCEECCDDGDGDTVRPMPLSSKEKQEAFRARQAMLGHTEVRGVFLPPELHGELKAYAKKIVGQAWRCLEHGECFGGRCIHANPANPPQNPASTEGG